MSIAAIEERSLRAKIAGLTASRNEIQRKLDDARRIADLFLINFYEIELQRKNREIEDARYLRELRRPPPEIEIIEPPEPEMYTLTVDIIGEGEVYRSPDRPSYLEGTRVILTAFPFEGSELKEWGGDARGKERYTMIIMDEAKTVTAEFTVIPYRLVEYVKYYVYPATESYKRRHFEIRGLFTIPADVDPASDKVLNNIERIFDDVMVEELGILIDDPGWEHRWTVGGEEVESVQKFDRRVRTTTTDLVRRYKYTVDVNVSEDDLVG